MKIHLPNTDSVIIFQVFDTFPIKVLMDQVLSLLVSQTGFLYLPSFGLTSQL